jgi:hypothetical protein
MAFLVQPNQLANMVYRNTLPPNTLLDHWKVVISPGQPIQGFPIEHLASEFPTGFINPSTEPCYFDLEAFQFTPPPWSPSGWFRMIHKAFRVISPTQWEYSWSGGNTPIHFVTVTLS